MKTKSGPIFWGGFFITLGLLFFLTKFDVIYTDWDFVWSLYPIIFVFIGILIIAKNSVFKPWASLTFGLFMAVLIYGSVSYFITDVHVDWDSGNYTQSFYSEEYKDSCEYATLNLEGGGGFFTIENPTDKLVNAKSHGILGDFKFRAKDSYDRAFVSFNQRGKHFSFFGDDVRSRLKISLNPNPLWDLNLDFGAAKAYFDLSYYRVKDAEIHTGLSDIKLKLGDKYHDTHIKVGMGVTSLSIEYPKDSGCKLEGDMVLFSKDLENMHNYSKNEGKAYYSDNFDEAENRIYITIEGGVSKLKIRTY